MNELMQGSGGMHDVALMTGLNEPDRVKLTIWSFSALERPNGGMFFVSRWIPWAVCKHVG